MFRLAEFQEDTPLFEYISEIASKTILNALNELFGESLLSVEDFYINTFSEDILGEDFFEGVASYISERADVTTDDFGEDYSDDTRAGIEFVFRKVARMKEKVMDPKRYYTFDLFEEYLFNEVIELYKLFREIGDDLEERAKPSIRDTTETLIKTYDLDEDEAAEIAESAWKVEKMGIDDSGLFFWDDDFAVVFDDGFVNGIRALTCGVASMLGYGYDDVCSIFTDAGIKAPLMLVGTKAAFDTVEEAAKEKMAETIDFPEPTGEFKKWLEGDDELPFG